MNEVPHKLPRHVAIIMDGNGRWAKQRDLSRTEGHLAGAESAREIGRCCLEFHIPYLTFYAFSTENWKRPREEVQFLMKQVRNYLREQRDEFLKHDIRVRTIGRMDGLPAGARRELEKTVRETAGCRSINLNVALNYGSRSEITDACRSIADEVKKGLKEPEDITESDVEMHLYTAGTPEPDLLIRTGGEKRLSNFLLWQLSYCEIYFTDVLWPDFRRDRFLEALQEFSRRERRFGGLRSRRREA